MFSLPQPVRYTCSIIMLTNDNDNFKMENTFKELLCVPSNFILCFFSYLFPDGRTQNPDLTGLCEPSPQDHIKVTQVRAVFFSDCIFNL